MAAKLGKGLQGGKASEIPTASIKPCEKHRFQVTGGWERARAGEEEPVPPSERTEQKRGQGGASHKGFSPALSAGFAGGGKYPNNLKTTRVAFRTSPKQAGEQETEPTSPPELCC